MKKVLIAAAVLIVVLLLLAVLGFGPGDSGLRTWVGRGAEARVRVRTAQPSDAVDAALGSVVRCRIDVNGSPETEWVCSVYEEPTRFSRRRQIGEYVGHGSEELVWDVTPGPIGVRVQSTAAFGREYERVEAVDGAEHEVAFVLDEGFRIAGTVRDSAGEPVAGVRLLFAPMVPFDPRGGDRFEPGPSPDRSLTVVTNDAGNYEVRADPQASYTGATTHPGFRVTREAGVVGEPGERVQLDFTLSPGHRIIGRLLLGPGVPLVGLPIELLDDQPNEFGTHQWQPEGRANTDADGRFAFDSIASGRKHLVAQGGVDGHETVCWIRGLELEGDGVTDLGDILVGGSLLEARVEVPDAETSGLMIRLHAFPDVETPDPNLLLHTVIMGVLSDGMVRVRGLPAGRVRVSISDYARRPEGFFREGVTYEERFDGDHLSTTWTLPPVIYREPVPQPRHITVEFPEDAGGLGIVLVGEQEPAVMCPGGGVMLRESDVAITRVIYCRDGRYGVQSPTLDGPDEQLFSAPLDRVGNTLRVRVTDSGRPVAQAEVSVGVGNPVMRAMRTDGEGHASLSGLPPDVALQVKARGGGKESATVPIEYVAGVAEIELVLK